MANKNIVRAKEDHDFGKFKIVANETYYILRQANSTSNEIVVMETKRYEELKHTDEEIAKSDWFRIEDGDKYFEIVKD